MTLGELDARFYGEAGQSGTGITFDCPVHRNHRLAVPFANPIGGGPSHPNAKGFAWRRQGTTLETLTLTPSIDASEYGDDPIHGPHVLVPVQNPGVSRCWHGFIRNGQVT